MDNQLKNEIAIVIVLYKTSIESCLTYITLKKHISTSKLDYQLIIYNNTENEKLQSGKTYQVVNSFKNEKLYGAYNYSLNYAQENHLKWLLLLDQDTEITRDYITKLSEYLNTDNDKEIVAIVPFLKENNKILSPQKISHFGWWQNQLSGPGYQTGRIIAFNSLSLLNVDFMISIGGFNKKYPLDMLDHWYYLQIFKLKKKVYVLDTYLEHQLSLSNYEMNVSLERHHDLLESEKAIVNELGKTYYLSYKLRLAIRMLKQSVFFKDKRYAKIIFKILFS